MTYTEEEIKKYLDILHNYTSKPEEEVSGKAKCCNCQNSEFLPLILATKYVMNVEQQMGMY